MRNRVPLNHAANGFREICAAAMKRVAAGASHESVDAEIQAAEDALAEAALTYATTKGMVKVSADEREALRELRGEIGPGRVRALLDRLLGAMS